MFKKSNGLRVPKDELGNPLYSYIKCESINGKENYKYRIWGDPLFIPDKLDGAPVPVASMFIDWYNGDCYIMRNDGWHKLGEDRPEVVVLSNPVSSIADTANINYSMTDSGETEDRFIGDILYKVPIYNATNDSTIYESEKVRDLAITLSELEGCTFKALKDGVEIEDLSEINCDLSEEIEFIIIQNAEDAEIAYGVIINLDATITPDPLPKFTINEHDYEFEIGMTFKDFVDSDYNPSDEHELVIGTDDVVFLNQTDPVKNELNEVQKKTDTIIEDEVYYSPSAPSIDFKVSANDVEYDFSFPSASDVSTFADFITSEYNPVAEGEAYLEQDSGHVLLIVNETSATYHVQDNEEDVAATDEIENDKTYTGVE